MTGVGTTKSAQIREALLAGDCLTDQEVQQRFDCKSGLLRLQVQKLQSDGYSVATQSRPNSGGRGSTKSFQVVASDGETTSAPALPVARPALPYPGDSLRVTGLFWNSDTGQPEIQASGPDGVYLLSVVTFHPMKGKRSGSA